MGGQVFSSGKQFLVLVEEGRRPPSALVMAIMLKLAAVQHLSIRVGLRLQHGGDVNITCLPFLLLI